MPDHACRYARRFLCLPVILLLLHVFASLCLAGEVGSRIYSGQLNVNAATAADLTCLPGVGEVLAGRIVLERQRLGRFTRLEQVAQVPGVTPRIYRQISPHLALQGEATFRVYLDVNRASEHLLLELPRMSSGEAKAIVRQRRESGPYRSLDDLSRVPGVTAARAQELRQWLAVAPAPSR